MKRNLWILAEERPKKEVLAIILSKFAKDYGFACFIDSLRIFPILNDDKFSFAYEVSGFRCNKVGNVIVKSVSGKSSFVDYLVFYQENEPSQTDIPIYAIEETKTDDKESRNTGVYQRCAKFVFIKNYYPNVKMIMLYNLRVEQKEKPTHTYIFGTKLLLTLGVEVLGKALDENTFQPFESVDEIIDFKSRMRKAPKGNIPISLSKQKEKIEISGRLVKNDSLSHDPNIGALSIICAALRKLGWNKDLEITHHGLKQKHLNGNNKFVQIANALRISLKGLRLPQANFDSAYWHYETEGEKLGTIFIHIVVENFTNGYSIFENHAGCEKSYFITKEGNAIPLAKYKDREQYKLGDKRQIIHIPDLILIDFGRSEIINVEGKKYEFRAKGVRKLKNYDYIEEHYVKKHYSDFKILRTVVLYGGNAKEIFEIEVGFLLNKDGDLILGINAPEIFKEAIKNLLDYWN